MGRLVGLLPSLLARHIELVASLLQCLRTEPEQVRAAVHQSLLALTRALRTLLAPAPPPTPALNQNRNLDLSPTPDAAAEQRTATTGALSQRSGAPLEASASASAPGDSADATGTGAGHAAGVDDVYDDRRFFVEHQLLSSLGSCLEGDTEAELSHLMLVLVHYAKELYPPEHTISKFVLLVAAGYRSTQFLY